MRRSKYRRQYNNQKENDKMTNNELQNTTHKKKRLRNTNHIKRGIGVNTCPPEG